MLLNWPEICEYRGEFYFKLFQIRTSILKTNFGHVVEVFIKNNSNPENITNLLELANKMLFTDIIFLKFIAVLEYLS